MEAKEHIEQRLNDYYYAAMEQPTKVVDLCGGCELSHKNCATCPFAAYLDSAKYRCDNKKAHGCKARAAILQVKETGKLDIYLGEFCLHYCKLSDACMAWADKNEVQLDFHPITGEMIDDLLGV